MSEEKALITIHQLPVIEQQLRQLKESWEQRARDAAAMVCTEDTVQGLKKIRADMRKEYTVADEQRKAAKKKYMEPWDAIEKLFKECVDNSFKQADDSLKNTINTFEGEIKAKCEQDLRAYYAELMTIEHLDFLSFEQAMQLGKISIGMTEAKRATPRKLMDSLGAVVSQVALGVEQIQKMDDAPAIMAEYKQCFDVGRAVSVVQERKRREAEEAAAAEARKAAQEAQAAAVAKVEAAAPQMPAAAPVAAPVQQRRKSPDDVFPEFTFTIYGATRAQLIRVRDFLKQEGLNYG